MNPALLSVEGIMDLSKTFQRLGLAAALAVLVAAVPARGQTAGVTGKATMQDGSPCVGCPVIIERLEIKGTYKCKTNKKGSYTYIGLPLGNYKITLQRPSGEVLFFFNNKHLGMGDLTEVNFDLAKEIAAAQKEQQANPEYQKKMEVQQKEEKQIAGLKSLYEEGNALYDGKKYAEAAEKFEQALALAQGKNRLAVLQRLGDAYANSHERDKSIASYQQALELDPTNAGVHNNLGNVYANNNEIDKARAEFQKAAELDPAHASQYYFNLGAVFYNIGKMDEAADAFKKCIGIDDKKADAYFWLGLALAGKMTTDASGKVIAPPGTLEAFQKYLDLEPNGPNAPAAQAQIQIIQGGVETKYVKKKKKS
jgi:tetratricopeptide (TPR) repeat protein